MQLGQGLLRPTLGYERWYHLIREHTPSPTLRAAGDVAVLATFTSDLLNELLPLAAGEHGLDLTVRPVPFGQVEQAVLDHSSDIYTQPPRHIVLAGSTADLVPPESTGPDTQTAEEWISEVVDRWTGLWQLCTQLGSHVIQLGFAPPAVDPLGSASWHTDGTASAIVNEVNSRLAKRAGRGVRFVDVARLASLFGLSRWWDARSWYWLRHPYSLDALPWLASGIAEAVAIEMGNTRRCVVTDLDNTLWGGVIGQDGTQGVTLLEGPDGEAYRAFQHHLRQLSRHGVVLAVSSKNDKELGERALTEIPGMVLQRNDFAAVKCGWEPKSRQLAQLADELHLSLGSMVFIDDDPAECAEVASAFPEVAVVHLSGSPSTFPAALASVPGLVPATGSADATRAPSYTGLARAREASAQATDLSAHLHSLDMHSAVTTIDSTSIARATDLINKTNQFNLTTRRRSLSELSAVLKRPHTRGTVVRLSDRFAEHGLIGVALTVLDGDTAEIDTLLLSCRVIGRSVEQNLISDAGRWALENGARRLVGRYEPTARNGLVSNLYDQLRFRLCEQDESGIRMYEFLLKDGPPTPSPYLHHMEFSHDH